MTIVNQLFSALKQSLRFSFLKKKNFLLIVSACLVLAACEEGADKSSTEEKDVRLLKPSAGLVLSLENEELRVQYKGAATPDNVAVELNGVLCSATVGATCRMIVHRQYGIVSASLASLAHIIVPGENTVVVINTDKNTRDTLTFYFDDQAPKLEVMSVIGGSGPSGEPMAGDTIDIMGRLVDPSAVRDLRITSAGTVHTLSLVPTTALAANQFTNTLNSDDDKTFYAQITWPNNNVANAQLSYTVTDVNNQTRTEAFIVPGTQLTKSTALQVNDDFYENVKVLINPIIKNLLALLQQEDQLVPLLANAIPQSIAGELCVALMDKPSNECFAEVEGINIVNPALHLKGSYTAGQVRAGMWLDALYVTVRIFHNCDPEVADCAALNAPRFRTTVHLDKFRLYSEFAIQPGVSGKLFSVARIPEVKLDLEGFLNKQAVLHNTSCTTGLCNVDPALLEFGYNLRLTAQGRELGGDLLSGITDAFNTVLTTKSCAIDALLDVADANCATAPEILAKNSVDDFISGQLQPVINMADLPLMVESVHKATNNGGHNVHTSMKLDSSNLFAGTLTQTVINQLGFGVPFANQNNYEAVKYSTYPHKVPGYGGEGIDLAFAVSANTVNQYVQALHRTGALNDITFDVVGTDLLNEIGLAGVNEVCLEVDAQVAPSPKVEFTGYHSKKTGVRFDLLGLSIINTAKEDVPGTIKLNANYLTVHIHNQACDTATIASRVVSTVVDASIHVSLNLVSGKPVIKGYNDFVNVMPRYPSGAVSVAGAGVVTSSLVASTFSKLLKQNITEQLNGFNQPQGQYHSVKSFFSSLNDQFICMSTSISVLPIGTSCSGTNLGTVDDFLYSFFVSPTRILPMEFGMKFSSFGIEPSGGFFTFTLGVTHKRLVVPGNFCPDANTVEGTYIPTEANFFRAICLE